MSGRRSVFADKYFGTLSLSDEPTLIPFQSIPNKMDCRQGHPLTVPFPPGAKAESLNVKIRNHLSCTATVHPAPQDPQAVGIRWVSGCGPHQPRWPPCRLLAVVRYTDKRWRPANNKHDAATSPGLNVVFLANQA